VTRLSRGSYVSHASDDVSQNACGAISSDSRSAATNSGEERQDAQVLTLLSESEVESDQGTHLVTARQTDHNMQATVQWQ
jgi:hypothetical protein